MSALVASLGMYDHASQQAANDLLWQAIAKYLEDRGIANVPRTLDRSRPVETLWHDHRLLFAQACGFPLVRPGAPAVQLVAFPIYTVLGAGGGTHASVVIAGHDDARRSLADFRGAVAAINAWTSNSGMNLLRAAIAPYADGRPFLAGIVETGSHRASLCAVAQGDADLAAIDAVTLAALAHAEPDLVQRVRRIVLTPSSPTLPFVTAAATPPGTLALLRAALWDAIARPELAAARRTLFLSGLKPAAPEALTPVTALAAAAIAQGYPDLA